MRALLVQDQEILFIHHAFKNPAKFGRWTFPGGRLDEDETDPVAALHREIEEELSVGIKVLGQVGRFYSRSGRDYTIFAAQPLGPIGPIQLDEIREVTWLTGVLLLLVVMGFGFTGYLLPWDQKAYWATTVGTRIASVAPVIGGWLLRVMRGGQELTAVTLARFFGVHVWVLPTALILLISIHLYLIIRIGISAVPDRGE